jgi:hypothetical protein
LEDRDQVSGKLCQLRIVQPHCLHAVADPIAEEISVSTLERNDLVNALGQHRDLLLRTVRGLTDAQARLTPTASQLFLGGIIKHVSLVEEGWVRFIEEGPDAKGSADEAADEAHAAGFRMADGETLPALIARYEAVARSTDELVAALPFPGRIPPTPRGPVVRARGTLVRPQGAPAHSGRDGPTRRSRRHHPRDHRRSEVHGLTGHETGRSELRPMERWGRAA